MPETYVFIKNLRLKAYHGVLPQEQRVGNDYVLNVKVGYPWYRASESDEIGDTLNYASLADVIEKEMKQPSMLLEHVAGRIAKSIKEVFPEVSSIQLSIKKLAPPIHQDTDGCGVEIFMTY